VKGLWGKPSLLNNVETYANIPVILTKGAEWFAGFGTEKSKGTKVFALAGKVNNTGLVEVPIGTPLGEILYDIGGGIPGGKHFKAAQLGGPSGGCIPKEYLNVPVDYETLTELGAIMGSGGLIVMDEDSCMVDVARFFLDFVQDESCGKCVPCRIGTKRMLEILNRICEGKGEEGDIERLEELGAKIKDTALCGLGQTAPNPVLSTIRHFRDEYVAHIRDKQCPAGVCTSLLRAPCQSGCPARVDIPGFVSLVGEKRYAEALRLHRERNPFASVCARVCFHTCEDKCRRATLDEAVSIRGLKRFMVEQEVTVQLPEMRDDEKNARRKIAIIGAGPAGLSCAYFMARLGYRPKVFEAEHRPGGMLVQTIPAYRMPREEVAREVRMIERLGVDIETGVRIGKDMTLQQLRDEGYEAVFVGVGAPSGTKMNIPGEELEGVTDAIGFLREYNIRGSSRVGNKVVVIGGGNAAVDAARSAVRLGAKKVTIVYRRGRDEMPAYAEEIEEAEHEGIVLKVLTAPIEIVGKDGKVTGVKCHEMTLGEFDKSGRRRPQDAGLEFVEEADQVIAAIGQQLDPTEIFDGTPVALARNKFIEVNPVTMQTSVPWLFAGGDASSGPSSVVEAVASGEKAAVGIDRMLSGEEHAFWRVEKEVNTFFDPEAEPVQYLRAKMALLPVGRRKHSFQEVEQAFNLNDAMREAKRCLRCDYCEK
jgi:NADH-quinone oxidoreductase subunit F